MFLSLGDDGVVVAARVCVPRPLQGCPSSPCRPGGDAASPNRGKNSPVLARVCPPPRFPFHHRGPWARAGCGQGVVLPVRVWLCSPPPPPHSTHAMGQALGHPTALRPTALGWVRGRQGRAARLYLGSRQAAARKGQAAAVTPRGLASRVSAPPKPCPTAYLPPPTPQPCPTDKGEPPPWGRCRPPWGMGMEGGLLWGGVCVFRPHGAMGLVGVIAAAPPHLVWG